MYDKYEDNNRKTAVCVRLATIERGEFGKITKGIKTTICDLKKNKTALVVYY